MNDANRTVMLAAWRRQPVALVFRPTIDELAAAGLVCATTPAAGGDLVHLTAEGMRAGLQLHREERWLMWREAYTCLLGRSVQAWRSPQERRRISRMAASAKRRKLAAFDAAFGGQADA